VTEEAFEVKYTGRHLPYTTERVPIGLRILPRLRPVTQITISAPHDDELESTQAQAVRASVETVQATDRFRQSILIPQDRALLNGG
jgi:hypothetical protein